MTDELKRDILLIVVTVLFISFTLGFGDKETNGGLTPEVPIVIP